MTPEEKSDMLEMMHDIALGFDHYVEHQGEESNPSAPFWTAWSEMRRELCEEDGDECEAKADGRSPVMLSAAQVAKFARLIKAMYAAYADRTRGTWFEGDGLARDIADELARILRIEEPRRGVA